MQVTSKNNNHWYIFLLFPFVAGIFAIKNYRLYWAKNIIWAFVVFFGFTFGISKETSSGTATADVFRYTSEVEKLNKKSLDLNEIIKLYRGNEDIDILKITIAICVSRFTDNPKVVLAIYGFIFGFFFSRNMWYVLDRLKGKIKPGVILLLVTYFLVNPFWNINGFRFHTATHIFIYGLLPFLYEDKKKGLWIASLSILVHFSFLLPVLILFVYVFLGNRTVAYFVFFIISIFTSEINVGQFNAIVERNVPQNFLERTSTYRNEENIEEFREGKIEGVVVQTSWHAKYYYKALNWSLIVLLIFLFFKRKVLKKINKKFLNSLSFTLLFWGVANIMSSLPSGGRFLAIAALSALAIVIFYVQNLKNEKYLTNKVMIISPALLLFIIVSIRVGFYSFTINTFLGNPLIVLISNYNIALNDFIK